MMTLTFFYSFYEKSQNFKIRRDLVHLWQEILESFLKSCHLLVLKIPLFHYSDVSIRGLVTRWLFNFCFLDRFFCLKIDWIRQHLLFQKRTNRTIYQTFKFWLNNFKNVSTRRYLINAIKFLINTWTKIKYLPKNALLKFQTIECTIKQLKLWMK